jgi:hypothetical protein
MVAGGPLQGKTSLLDLVAIYFFAHMYIFMPPF